MLEEGLAPEDVDAITGEPMAHPKSASFRTADLVGLDTFVHVADELLRVAHGRRGPQGLRVPAYITAMVEKKLLGDKTKGGFYKRARTARSRRSTRRRSSTAPSGGDEEIGERTQGARADRGPAERVRKLVADPGKAGQFAWKVLSRSLAVLRRGASARLPTTWSRSMTR